MRKFVAVAFLGLLLTGCSSLSSDHSTIQLLTYQCGAVPLIVALDNENDVVTTTLDGKLRTLPHSIAASGAKYEYGEYIFWSKGDEATIFKNDQIMLSNCILVK